MGGMFSAVGLALTAFYLSLTLICGYGVFFADLEADHNTTHGRLSRFILSTLPTFISTTTRSLCGESAAGYLAECYHYAVHERNPLLQGTYLVILNSAFVAWMVFGDHKVPCYLVQSRFYSYMSYAGIALCQATFYLACSVPPGIITEDNVSCYMHHKYDGLIFSSDALCSTCNIPKVTT